MEAVAQKERALKIPMKRTSAASAAQEMAAVTAGIEAAVEAATKAAWQAGMAAKKTRAAVTWAAEAAMGVGRQPPA